MKRKSLKKTVARKHNTLKKRKVQKKAQRKRTYKTMKRRVKRKVKHNTFKKTKSSRRRKKRKPRYVKINKTFYSKGKRGGEFMLFPDFNGAKNSVFDSASNFMKGMKGVNNMETGNVMEQDLQSGEYDITGSKQLLAAAEQIAGPEAAPQPTPPTTGNCATV